MAETSLSLIIPFFNEEPNVNQVVHHALTILGNRPMAFEVILVNDGSVDNTGAIMEEIARCNPNVHAIHHSKNCGLGAALRTGFDKATGSFITWIPGDGQFDLEEVLAGMRQMPQKDCVLAIRKGRNAATRSIISLCFHGLIRVLFRFDATDVSGVWIIKKSVLQEISPRSNDIFLNLEIPLLCVRHQKQLGSITVFVKPRLSGVSKVANLRTMAKNLWEMMRFRYFGR